MKKHPLALLTFALGFVLAACGGAAVAEPGLPASNDEPEIVTLLPRDAIPSIDNPRFYSVEEANQEYDPNEFVLGLVIDGQARAYSTGLLSSHEIVNDVVAGRPIAVTW